MGGLAISTYEKPPREELPPGVVTLTFPLAPLPTVALMVESLVTLKEAAAVPPKVTTVAPVKAVPLIWIVYPSDPEFGEKERTLGGGTEMKVKPARESTPPDPVTAICPLAPLPTTAVTTVELTRLKDLAATPPKVTELMPLKLAPCIVTV